LEGRLGWVVVLDVPDIVEVVGSRREGVKCRYGLELDDWKRQSKNRFWRDTVYLCSS
jgi:hypothetical protein